MKNLDYDKIYRTSLEVIEGRFTKNEKVNENKIEKLTENLKSIFENYWKSKNEINTSVKLPLIVSIDNNDNSEISKFELILTNIDLIYDFNIYK